MCGTLTVEHCVYSAQKRKHILCSSFRNKFFKDHGFFRLNWHREHGIQLEILKWFLSYALDIFFHTATHVSLNRERSACRFLLKQQKLLLQLDWLLPYLLLLQLLLKKQLLPSHALMLKLHLEPCCRLRWLHSSLAHQKRAYGCGPFWNVARKVARDLCKQGLLRTID